jgi:hypothetical protein
MTATASAAAPVWSADPTYPARGVDDASYLLVQSPLSLTTSGTAPRGAVSPGSGVSRLLLGVASVLLLALAVAMGLVSWHAQYAFIFSVKHQQTASALEALGLDTGAVVFSVLGIALARLGRRAVIERVLVCVCAAWSCVMNAAGADLGSARSVAAFVMPPVLFAITSDRLVSVIRRTALGPGADSEAQRSAWRAAGIAALYVLRLAAAPVSTVRGARGALLCATPLPGHDALAASLTGPLPVPPQREHAGSARRNKPTKAAQLVRLAGERHDLADVPLEKVSRLATEIAGEIGYHPGTARRVLLAHVRRLQGARP